MFLADRAPLNERSEENSHIVGYARVSTVQSKQESSLAAQVKELKAAGATKIFKEKILGSAKVRPEFERMLDYVREGDIILTCKLDRLTRSIGGLAKLLETLKNKDVGFRVLDNPALGTTTAHGELVIKILSACTSFERQIISTRVSEGRATALERGVKFGPKPKVTEKKIRKITELYNDGYSGDEISKDMSLSRATVFRALKRLKDVEELV